jgi:hypothetical protein
MNAERIKLAHIIYLFCRFSIESLAAEGKFGAECDTALNNAALAVAVTQLKDSLEGEYHEQADSALFEAMLLAGGHCEDECDLARALRQDVLILASKMIDPSVLRRGDDPPNCDPGGGMRSPDYRYDDDQS